MTASISMNRPNDFMRLALRQHFASIWLDAARANAELQAQVDAAYARMNDSWRRELQARDAERNRAWTEYAQAAGYEGDAAPARTADHREGGGAKAAPVGAEAAGAQGSYGWDDFKDSNWQKIGAGVISELAGEFLIVTGVGATIAAGIWEGPLAAIHVGITPGITGMVMVGGNTFLEGWNLIREGFAEDNNPEANRYSGEW